MHTDGCFCFEFCEVVASWLENVVFLGMRRIRTEAVKLQADSSAAPLKYCAIEATVIETLYSVETLMAASDVRYPFLLYVHLSLFCSSPQ